MVFQGTYKLMIEKKSLDLLKTLIGFDTTSFKSNLNLIMFIEDYLNQYKIKSELVYDETKNKANLFATIGPSSSGGIVLSGHTDVVPVTNQKWDSDPFQLIEKDKKLFGRGTSDMKSFIGLVLSRVPKIVEKKLSKPIHLAFSYDEEIGCVGVHGLLELIEKKSIKLLLKVKNFSDELAKELSKDNKIKNIQQNNNGKHDVLVLELKEENIPWVTDFLVAKGIQIFSIEPQKNSHDLSPQKDCFQA